MSVALVPTLGTNPTQEPNHSMHQTARLLDLAVAQIEISMREGDDSVDSLARSFASMVATIGLLQRDLEDLGGHVRPESGSSGEIARHCEQVKTEMQRAVVAFQFYDKLTQRLGHVRDGLDRLGKIVSNPQQFHSIEVWHRLQEDIRSRYTMEVERYMFDTLMSGATVEDALATVEYSEAEPNDDVELF